MATFKESLNETIRKSNGRMLSDDELNMLKSTLLECLKDIQQVCEKNGIHIMLGGGSCLGAVRHKGFIPWDDDLDLNISREDYEVFKKVFKEELGSKYILNAPNYEGDSISRFPKILIKGTRFVELGMRKDDPNALIKIDMFIAENIPDSKICRFIKGWRCNLLMGIAGSVEMYQWYKRDSENEFFIMNAKNKSIVLRKVAGAVFSVIPLQRWYDMVDKACRYSNDSKELSFPTGRKHYFGEIHEKNDIFPLIKSEFEGMKVYIPCNYQKYLKKLYGENYMLVPPVEKREKHFILDIAFNQLN